MIPIYVISLKDSVERRKSIKSQCDTLGLEFKFFDAIDTRDGLSAEQEKNISRGEALKRGKELTPAEIGCAMSHALLCKLIAESDHTDGAIILEDDAMLSHDFLELLQSEKMEESGEQLIILRHSFAYVSIFRTPRLFKKYRLCTPIRNPWGGVGYYVSQSGAACIYKNSWPIVWVADWAFDIRKIGAKLLVPRIIDHFDENEHASIIGERSLLLPKTKMGRLLSYESIRFKFLRVFSTRVS